MTNRFRRHRIAAACAAALLSPTLAFAAVPIGGEFTVSGPDTGPVSRTQIEPAIAMDARGNSVIAWTDDTLEGGGTHIVARRYGADGRPFGAPFQVDTVPPDGSAREVHPSVAMDPSGNFIVTWERFGMLFARRYSANPTSAPGEVLILFRSTATADLSTSAVALSPDGAFAIVFQIQTPGPTPELSVQTFDAQDQRTTVGIDGYQMPIARGVRPAISADAAGDFVVATVGPFTEGSTDLIVQRFDATAMSLGGQILVAPGVKAEQPALASAPNGDFIVAWSDDDTDGSGHTDIYARRYRGSNGAPKGDAARVNQYAADDQLLPSVSVDAFGDYVVAWQDLDAQGSDVFARAFTSQGVARGNQRRINSVTRDEQQDAVVAMDADGDFTVAWRTGRSSLKGLTDDVHAQRLRGSSQADLGIALKGTTHVAPGAEFSMRIDVTNASKVSGATGVPSIDGAIRVANNVRVVYELPAGSTFVRAISQGDAWNCVASDAPTVTCTYSVGLFPKTPAPFISIKARTSSTASGSLTSRASVSSDQGDPVAANDAATAVTTIDP